MVIDLTLDHLWMTVQITVLTVLFAVPLARLSMTNRWLRAVAVVFTNSLYAVPSLALFMMVPVLVGVPLRSTTNVVIVLTLYGVAVIWRSTLDAFDTLPPRILDASDAMGVTRWRRFWSVELPLASPVLVSALRVVLASTISLITVGAVIGVPSLGLLFTDGFQRGITAEVITGIVVVVALGWLLDRLVAVAGAAAMPWRATTPRRSRRLARRVQAQSLRGTDGSAA
ncbi:ABC transporter permease [Jonesia quinghaiensis]|uniref:ABC transporter permease n=1 Tax=Jonesia quinghaiensis TaxID=262806 RepID=UPI001FE1F104|nr:ABC transporter permease subunit [Jonesia quinghaiensis]